MTENEAKAIKWIKNVRDDAVITLDHIQKNEPNVSPMLYEGRKQKAEIIIGLLDELEVYRAIGTVEEIKSMIRKSDFTQKPSKEELISELKELSKMKMILECYEAIGTVEEFKTLKEKNEPKKPIRNDLCTCPSCGTYNETVKKRRNTVNMDIVYCWHCGQAMEIKRGVDHE